VVQVLLLAFHPWTNRIGSCVGFGLGGLRALSALVPAIGPVGASMPQAPNARNVASERNRVERRIGLMKNSQPRLWRRRQRANLSEADCGARRRSRERRRLL